MNDEELEARLRTTLQARAGSVTNRPDAWEEYNERTPMAAAPAAAGHPLRWLSVAAAAALIVFVVVRVTSSPSVKVTAVAPETTDTVVPTSLGPSTTIETTTTIPGTTAVPAGFVPTSVTFVSLHTGWVLGTVFDGNTFFTELLRTRDGGKTWVALPPPHLSPDVPAGARHIRFGNLNDGWIFGSDLWVTHDGGYTWAQPSVEGVTAVTALETDGALVHAVFISSTPDVKVATSPVDHDDWQVAPVSIPIGAGPVPSTQLVVQGSDGWIIENNRVVVGGARLEQGKWTEWQPPCIDNGGPAVLTASRPTVVVVCNEGVWTGGTITHNVFVSSDAGTSFQEITPPLSGDFQLDGVASAGPDTIVIGGVVAADSRVLEATFDGGESWTAVYSAPGLGFWTDLGFTGPTQGIGIVFTERYESNLVMTVDGGHTWTPVDFYAAS